MKRLLSLLYVIPLCIASPVAAECLAITDQGLSLEEGEGAARASWFASIENRCQLPQDALLSVRFVGADDEVLYEVSDQTVIARLTQKRVERRVYVPSHHGKAITGIVIELEERERPM